MAYNYGQNLMNVPGYPYVSGTPMYNGYSQQPQPSQQQNNAQGMIWVDGEVGAKAFQMPQGWPVGVPIALWDTNEPVIYLKSINQMGMPNPLQKIHYTIDNQQTPVYLPAGNSGTAGNNGSIGNGNYATKEDFEQIKNEVNDIKNLLKNGQQNMNQNGSNNGQNRGANR